jgi:stage III sporulation protein AG
LKRAESEVRALSLSSLWKSQYLKIAALGVLGISLLLVGTFYGKPAKAKDTAEMAAGSLSGYETSIAATVEEALGAVKGVGKVEVKVTLEMGPESVYARNVTKSSTSSSETTSTGESRENASENETSQPVTGRFGTTDSPLVERVAPVKIGGCLVIAEGASSSRVKQDIYRAVETLLNIPMYKIQVQPMKGGR